MAYKFDREYYLSLTEKCNWNCAYCDFPKKELCKTVPIEQVLEAIELIKKVTNNSDRIDYCLEGGEIGLLTTDYLDQIFDSGLAETYTVTTNGLFMQRGYHERYKDRIHYILYHVMPDLAEQFNFTDYEFDPRITVHYTIVITKDNIQHLEGFLDYHADKMFLPHIMQPRTDDVEFLAKDHYQRLHDIIKDRSNVTPGFKSRLPKILAKCEDPDWIAMTRTKCANVYTQPIFDLPNMMINRCCISITGDAVPFNEENLTRLWNNEILFHQKKDKVCDGCIANFMWHEWNFEKYSKEVQEILRKFDNDQNP